MVPCVKETFGASLVAKNKKVYSFFLNEIMKWVYIIFNHFKILNYSYVLEQRDFILKYQFILKLEDT